jgi:NAD(P)-dependent dehydrogenase (short-subunit alcohol dehydrogenase family)
MTNIPAAWTGKVAVVTGGASGIGEATAAEFASRGAKVVILDRVRPSTGSSNARFISCDVSSSHEIESAVAQVSKEFRNVAFLVNSAGIQRYGTGVTTSEQTWDEVMSINVKAMFLSFRAFFPLMKSAGASVVNVSSVQGVGALPNSVAYVTSKHAITGLTRALAIDHAQDNIRVNCVCPGAVDTPMFRSSAQNTDGLASLLQEIAELHALGRIARPEEIAKVIAFLCSDDTTFMTGGVYLVDGGMTALVAGKPPLRAGKNRISS